MVRSHLVETLDQTVLRAAAGLVAIAVAAAATEQDSAAFIRFGSLLVAAYIGFTGTVQLAMARRDAEQRLGSFEVVIRGRGAHLASDVLTALGNWRRQLRRRLRWMRAALVASAGRHLLQFTPSGTPSAIDSATRRGPGNSPGLVAPSGFAVTDRG